MATASSRAAGYYTEKSEFAIPGDIHTCLAAYVYVSAAGWGEGHGGTG